MNKITIDNEMRDRLDGLVRPVKLCDEDGRVVAVVTPVHDSSLLEPQISKEELEDRFKNPGRLYTTVEVLAHLKSL